MICPRIEAIEMISVDAPFAVTTWTLLLDPIEKPLCIMRITNTSDVDVLISWDYDPLNLYPRDIVPAYSAIELNFQNNAPHSTDACFGQGKPVYYYALGAGKIGSLYFSGYTFIKD
jgi:hypothetical protein